MSSVRAKASLNGRSQAQVAVFLFWLCVLARVPFFVIKATRRSLATDYEKQRKQKKTTNQQTNKKRKKENREW